MNTLGSGWTWNATVEPPYMFYYYNIMTGEFVLSLHGHPIASTNSFLTMLNDTCENMNRMSFISMKMFMRNNSCSDVLQKLTSRSMKYDGLRVNIMTARLHEWSCCYLQIMEHFFHNVFQSTEGTKFEPPCWFLQGLQRFRQVFSHHRTVSALTELLLFMCGSCTQNGIVRAKIEPYQFLKLLCGGIMLIEEFLQFPGYKDVLGYRYMLQELIESIRYPISDFHIQAIDIGYLGLSGHPTARMMLMTMIYQ